MTLDEIISQLHTAQSAAQSAESSADDASNGADDIRGYVDNVIDSSNDASGYSNDAAEQIDSVISDLQEYLDAQKEEAPQEFMAVLEFLGEKLSDIKSTVSSATNLVTNALADMKNETLPLVETESATPETTEV